MLDTLTLYDRAAIIPGRSCTRSKAPDHLRKAWASHGDGAVLTDTTGKTYIDMVCGLGAISLGYQSNREFTDYWQHGVYSLPHESEVDAAEAVLRHVAPWASHVRFVKSGSEATTAAYRIAKKATGRPWVATGDWSYHGWHEWTTLTSTFPYGGDVGQALRHLSPENIAAVFIEPHRFEPVSLEWLRSVREFCDQSGRCWCSIR